MSNEADNKMALPPGTVLNGKYRVESVLGHGGFGITYYARDTSISREVAIKECLPADFAWREGTTVLPKATQYREDFEWARDRFMDEARTLAQFDHPAIVKVYDIFEANDTSYMVTRYEPGWTLPEYLQAMGRTLSEEEIRVFLHSLLEGLEQVHEAGYLHRDIKPENIYITERGQSLLLDFGSARQAVSNRSRPMTSVVTPGYAPFEQYHEEGNQGPWSDLYALAACIHYMLRGKPPPEATLRERNDPYEPLATVFLSADEWDPSFIRAIDAALSVDETARPQSADDFRDLLDAPVETAEEEQEREAADETSPANHTAPQYPSADTPTAASPTDGQKDSGLPKALPLLVGVLVALITAWYFDIVPMRDSDSYEYEDDAGNSSTQPSSPALTQEEQNQQWFEKAEEFYENQEYTKAVKWYRKAAEQGNPDAQNSLGWMYLQGQGVAQDDAKAVEWVPKAANQGLAEAQSNLGLMYDNGRGVAQDDAKAAEWYRKAAEQGDAPAQFYLATMYDFGSGVSQDHAKAVEWYRKAAEQGDTDAQFSLATMYEEGSGVVQDDVKAAEWYSKAAEQGDAAAQNSLGWMYEQGSGVAQDESKAVEWYRKAAEQGHARGQYNLGAMYDQGIGVVQDDAKAVEWYRKSAEQGDAEAQEQLGVMYYEGTGVPQNRSKAAEWTRKAAEQGHAWGQYNLGVLYDHGKGVSDDDVKAVEWYRKAAEQGHAQAQYKLGWMYYVGKGVAQDDAAKTVEWYRKAAEQGHAQAQYNLGLLYHAGEEVPQDDVKATKWYRKAAEQGDAGMQYNLGNMYARGTGVAQDDSKAVEWYRKSAEQGFAQAQYELAAMYYEGKGVPKDHSKSVEWTRKAAEQGHKKAQKALKELNSYGFLDSKRITDDDSPINMSGAVVLQAKYGADGEYNDVASIIQNSINNGEKSIRVGNNTMGGDPKFGVSKKLELILRTPTGTVQKTVREGDTLKLR